MLPLEFPEDDEQPAPPPTAIENQPNAVFRAAYHAFRASSAPRFLLHLFLPYAENEYRVLVDAELVQRPDDADTIIGEMWVSGPDKARPRAVITFGYGMSATCIVAAHENGTVTVDYREADTFVPIADSDNVIEPEHWNDAGLLGDALDGAGWALDHSVRGKPETPVRYQIACAPIDA